MRVNLMLLCYGVLKNCIGTKKTSEKAVKADVRHVTNPSSL